MVLLEHRVVLELQDYKDHSVPLVLLAQPVLRDLQVNLVLPVERVYQGLRDALEPRVQLAWQVLLESQV